MAKRIELADAHRITSDGANFRRPAWSSDGRRLIVEAGEGEGGLYLVDGRGRIEARLGDGAEAAWSPEGARLAFTRIGADGRREVWVCDVATPGSARRLAGGDGGIWEHPAWSPDGTRVACTSDFGSPVRHLWLLDAVQGDRTRITSDPQRSDGHPSWSPDGRALAFDGDDRGDDAREIDIHVCVFQTGAITLLTDGTVACRRPCFIDRRYLVAERRSVTGPALVVIDRDRQRVLPINQRPDGEREPAVRLRVHGKSERPRIQVAYVRRGPAPNERDAVWVAELEGIKAMSEAEAVDEALTAALADAAQSGAEALPTVAGELFR